MTFELRYQPFPCLQTQTEMLILPVFEPSRLQTEDKPSALLSLQFANSLDDLRTCLHNHVRQFPD